jgi:hypothetical protein
MVPGTALKNDFGGSFSCWNCRESFTEKNTLLEDALVNFFSTVSKIINGEKNAHAELRLEILCDDDDRADSTIHAAAVKNI